MILKLLLEVWDVSPKSNVCVTLQSVKPNSLLLRLRIGLRRVRLSLIKKGQWRKKWAEGSISWPQLHEGFILSWTLCLNSCSLQWLRPSLSLVISFIPLGLWQSKKGIWGISYEIKYFFLKDWNILRVSKVGI